MASVPLFWEIPKEKLNFKTSSLALPPSMSLEARIFLQFELPAVWCQEIGRVKGSCFFEGVLLDRAKKASKHANTIF